MKAELAELADLTILNAIIKFLKQKWADSEAGYVNQGDDSRLFGRVGAFLQHCLSVRPPVFKKAPYMVIHRDPVWFIGMPLYVVANVPIEDGKFKHYRLGWRYDINWTETGGYIFSIARKVLDRPMIYK